MNIAYCDTIAGISGDMVLGAFLHAGVPLDFLQKELRAISLDGFEILPHHVQQHALSAISVEIRLSDHHHHENNHHRSYRDIEALIKDSSLKPRVRERALSVFSEIAKAEAKIHNVPLHEVHFHEVGAVDSIIDIVGACICLEFFGIEALYSSPVKLGSGGLVNTRHGTMPVPTPATMEILNGYPTILTEIPMELTTPTGAGMIKALSKGMLTMERLQITAVGYGAGSREVPGIPNLLRVMVGTISEPFQHDELISIETNIDDLNPELYPYVIEQLLASGAHDAFLVPIIMKKGRPGILLSVLAERTKMDSLLHMIFAQTSTIGIRIQPIERRKLDRTSRTVETPFGSLTVKVIVLNGRERLVPEFEECKRVALEKSIPLLEVYKVLEAHLLDVMSDKQTPIQ
jgi:uncharacterized protein (TIGR00299 family) protein